MKKNTPMETKKESNPAPRHPSKKKPSSGEKPRRPRPENRPGTNVEFIDYTEAKNHLSVIQVAEQLGYRLDRSAGLKYPVYVLRDGKETVDSIVISGANDPTRQGYFSHKSGEKGDLITFIQHRIDSFSGAVGSSERERINGALRQLLGNTNAALVSPTTYMQARQEAEAASFRIENYETVPVRCDRGVPLLQDRGITRDTLALFEPFLLWVRERDPRAGDGEKRTGYSNLAFPFRVPGNEAITNLEIRYKQGDKNIKRFAKGGDRSESSFVASWVPCVQVRELYLFEAVIDLISFVQLHPDIDRSQAAFVAFGGSITEGQMTRLLDHFAAAERVHTCYDNDLAGHLFDIKTAGFLIDEEIRVNKVRNQECYRFTFRDEIWELSTGEVSLENFLKNYRIEFPQCTVMKPATGKDWNDQLIATQHPILQNMSTTIIMEETKKRQRSPALEYQKEFNEAYARILSSGTMEAHVRELLGMLEQLNTLRTKEGIEPLYLEKLERYRESVSPVIHSQNTNHMGTNQEEHRPSAGEKKTKFSYDQVPWDELKKIGIHEDFLSKVNPKTEKSQLNQLLETGQTGIITAQHKVSDELYLKAEGKLSMYEANDGTIRFSFDSVKKNLDIPQTFLGYEFTPEDRVNLTHENNLFKRVHGITKAGREVDVFLGVDPDMKSLVVCKAGDIRFQESIGGVTLTREQQEQLQSGQPVYVENMQRKKDGELFSAYLTVNPLERTVKMSREKPNVYREAQSKGTQKTQAQKTENDDRPARKAKKRAGMGV